MKREILFVNGSEKVVKYNDGNVYVEGAGYQFKVMQIDGNVFVTGGIRKGTKEFLNEYKSII